MFFSVLVSIVLKFVPRNRPKLERFPHEHQLLYKEVALQTPTGGKREAVSGLAGRLVAPREREREMRGGVERGGFRVEGWFCLHILLQMQNARAHGGCLV